MMSFEIIGEITILKSYTGTRRMISGRVKSSANAIWIEEMKRAKHETPLFAVRINNAGYPASLELHKNYRVVADEDAAQD
jgi:hypothetical protein